MADYYGVMGKGEGLIVYLGVIGERVSLVLVKGNEASGGLVVFPGRRC